MYYSTEAQLEELLQTLDKEKWEEDLVKNIEDMKEEILRQMTITEQLTAESKAGKKSMLEIENGMCEELLSTIKYPFMFCGIFMILTLKSVLVALSSSELFFSSTKIWSFLVTISNKIKSRYRISRCFYSFCSYSHLLCLYFRGTAQSSKGESRKKDKRRRRKKEKRRGRKTKEMGRRTA